MEWLPKRDKKSAVDQEPGGDIVMASSGAADDTLVNLTQKTDMVLKEALGQFDLEEVKSRGYDSFGYVFSGRNQTKLPAAELLRLQTHQLQRVRDFGYAPEAEAAGPGPGFIGTAFLSLLGFDTYMWGPGSPFFEYALQRLASAAEASHDLREFLHVLNPNITSTNTENGWEMYYGGVIRMHWGARTIPAATFVHFFLSGAEHEWVNAQEQEAQWEQEEEEEAMCKQNSSEH